MLFAGGGIETGQVIGRTDARGEDVVRRRFGPGDFLATTPIEVPDLEGLYSLYDGVGFGDGLRRQAQRIVNMF